jgi:hypothetical protein
VLGKGSLIVTNPVVGILDKQAGHCDRTQRRDYRATRLKPLFPTSSLVVTVLWSAVLPARAQVNVTQEHNNLSRDGLYDDSAFTPANAANLIRDLNFDGTISGNVYTQPLYIEGGPKALGITGTPVVDLASRSLFLDAMIDGTPKKHFVYSLDVDTGATNPNWPVDLNATVNYKGTTFTSKVQNQRGGLAIVNGVLYVPFSGHYGDCGNYRGWVVGIPINDPSRVSA